MTLWLFSNRGSAVQGSHRVQCSALSLGEPFSILESRLRGGLRQTFRSYPCRRQLFHLRLLMTQIVVNGRGDDQRQHHRDQYSANYGDSQRL